MADKSLTGIEKSSDNIEWSPGVKLSVCVSLSVCILIAGSSVYVVSSNCVWEINLLCYIDVNLNLISL